MSKAETTNTTRRRFLSQAAGVAAGSAALTMAGAMPSPAAGLQNVPADDPIYAAIEAHKAARAAVVSTVNANEALVEELPRDKRQSNVTAWGEEIIETDDP